MYVKLPYDAGNHLAEAFLHFSMYTGQVRGGVGQDPEDLRETGEDELDLWIGRFRNEMSKVPDSVIDDIEQIGKNAAWHTANMMVLNIFDAPGNKDNFD